MQDVLESEISQMTIDTDDSLVIPNANLLGNSRHLSLVSAAISF